MANDEYETRWVIVGYAWQISFKSERIAKLMANKDQRVVEIKIKKPSGPFSDDLEFDILDPK